MLNILINDKMMIDARGLCGRLRVEVHSTFQRSPKTRRLAANCWSYALNCQKGIDNVAFSMPRQVH